MDGQVADPAGAGSSTIRRSRPTLPTDSVTQHRRPGAAGTSPPRRRASTSHPGGGPLAVVGLAAGNQSGQPRRPCRRGRGERLAPYLPTCMHCRPNGSPPPYPSSMAGTPRTPPRPPPHARHDCPRPLTPASSTAAPALRSRHGALPDSVAPSRARPAPGARSMAPRAAPSARLTW